MIRAIGRRGQRLRTHGLLFGPLCDFVRGSPCAANCGNPGEPHHVKSRGSGHHDWLSFVDDYGTLIDAWGNIVPLCFYHHRQLHDHGAESFQTSQQIDLSVTAQAYGEVFKMHRPAEWAKLEAALGGF